jgi:hypothetical protein
VSQINTCASRRLVAGRRLTSCSATSRHSILRRCLDHLRVALRRPLQGSSLAVHLRRCCYHGELRYCVRRAHMLTKQILFAAILRNMPLYQSIKGHFALYWLCFVGVSVCSRP